MPVIDLPVAGEQPWDVKLNTAITTINDAVDDLEDATVPAGGTTGQVLTKDSATDGDVSWQSPTVASVGPTPTTAWTLRTGIASGLAGTTASILSIVPLMAWQAVHIDAFFAVAGSTTAGVHNIGIYGSNANGTPDFASGPLRTATVNFNAGATQTVTFSSLALTAGKMYYAAWNTPSTAPPNLPKMGAASAFMPFAPSGWGRDGVGYYDTGQTSLPGTSFVPTVSNTATNNIHMNFRIASVP